MLRTKLLSVDPNTILTPLERWHLARIVQLFLTRVKVQIMRCLRRRSVRRPFVPCCQQSATVLTC